MAFYRVGMGLPTQGIFGTEFEDGAVVFFNLKDNLILALWPSRSLSKDAGIELGSPGISRFSIGHNVNSKEEVDEIMRQAEQAGAQITDPAHKRFWGGYSGYFADPDGHLWEIVYNPDLQVEA